MTMGWFSKKAAPAEPYRPVRSDAKTTEQWRTEERKKGCATCGKTGCDRMKHSYVICGGCSSPYCNGDGCPGKRGRIRNCPNCGGSLHSGRC